MPQMAPMMWLILFFGFLLSLFCFVVRPNLLDVILLTWWFHAYYR